MAKPRTRKLWTQQEIDYIREVYADTPTDQIAQQLGRSCSSVYGMAGVLSLSKSEAYHQAELAKQAERLKEIGSKTRFQKGACPPNKGKKMPAHVYEAVKHTFFKSGHKPPNTKYDGHERICPNDGYILIRVRQGEYKAKHRVVWEQHYGPIPKDMVIRFKDNNKLNTAIVSLLSNKLNK